MIKSPTTIIPTVPSQPISFFWRGCSSHVRKDVEMAASPSSNIYAHRIILKISLCTPGETLDNVESSKVCVKLIPQQLLELIAASSCGPTYGYMNCPSVSKFSIKTSGYAWFMLGGIACTLLYRAPVPQPP